MRLQFQKRSALKLASRIIPRKRRLGGGDEAYCTYVEETDNDPCIRRATLPTKIAL
jgi:hypothetical protein